MFVNMAHAPGIMPRMRTLILLTLLLAACAPQSTVNPESARVLREAGIPLTPCSDPTMATACSTYKGSVRELAADFSKISGLLLVSDWQLFGNGSHPIYYSTFSLKSSGPIYTAMYFREMSYLSVTSSADD